MSRRISYVFFVLGGLVLIRLLANFLPLSLELSLLFTALNLSLFGAAGFFGFNREYFPPLNIKTIVQGVLYGLLITFINSFVGGITLKIASLFWESGVVEHLIMQERSRILTMLTTDNVFITAAMAVLLVVGAPLCEELFFRGLLLDLFAEQRGTKQAVFFSALVFAILHFYLLQFPQVLVSGLILGWLFVTSKNIAMPIIAHSVVNSIGLLVYLLVL